MRMDRVEEGKGGGEKCGKGKDGEGKLG